MTIAFHQTSQQPRQPLRNKETPAISLDNVGIASPCPVSWAGMSGDDRVRHCHECKLNVYNLSEMTRTEAEQLIASRDGRLCVRFFRRADGTILTQDCPRRLRVLSERVSRIGGAVLSAMLSVIPAFSQAPTSSTSQGQPTSANTDKNAQLGLEVTIVDPTGAVIQNAEVVLCRCKDKITNKATTDPAGTAHFTGLAKGTYEISIEAPRFKKVERRVTINKSEQLQVKVQIASQTTTVEVKASPVEIVGTMGMVAVIDTAVPPIPALTGRARPLR